MGGSSKRHLDLLGKFKNLLIFDVSATPYNHQTIQSQIPPKNEICWFETKASAHEEDADGSDDDLDKFKKNDKVEFELSYHWICGIIDQSNGNGTYDVKSDDGKVHEEISQETIRIDERCQESYYGAPQFVTQERMLKFPGEREKIDDGRGGFIVEDTLFEESVTRRVKMFNANKPAQSDPGKMTVGELKGEFHKYGWEVQGELKKDLHQNLLAKIKKHNSTNSSSSSSSSSSRQGQTAVCTVESLARPVEMKGVRRASLNFSTRHDVHELARSELLIEEYKNALLKYGRRHSCEVCNEDGESCVVKFKHLQEEVSMSKRLLFSDLSGSAHHAFCDSQPESLTEKFVRDLLYLPIIRGDGSGIMILIRMCQRKYGETLFKALRWAQEILALEDHFALLADFNFGDDVKNTSFGDGKKGDNSDANTIPLVLKQRSKNGEELRNQYLYIPISSMCQPY